MNELNPTNAFGEVLLDLIDGQYGGDYDAGISAIMESTGLSEEEVVAIVQGDVIVEEESLLSQIVDAFPDANDEDLEVIVNVATAVDEEDRAELISEIEADEAYMGGYEDGMAMEPEMEMAGAEYSARPGRSAQFSSQESAYVRQLQNEIQSVKSEFANFQAYEALESELKDINAEASAYVSQEILPPSYKTMLIGNFADNGERVARFSQLAETNGVDMDTMIFATRYALGVLKASAPFMEFRDFSMSDEEVATANFSASLDDQVRADLSAIFDS